MLTCACTPSCATLLFASHAGPAAAVAAGHGAFNGQPEPSWWPAWEVRAAAVKRTRPAQARTLKLLLAVGSPVERVGLTDPSRNPCSSMLPQVRILKFLLAVESPVERAKLLDQAFTAGPALSTADADYLSTTPQVGSPVTGPTGGIAESAGPRWDPGHRPHRWYRRVCWPGGAGGAREGEVDQ